VLSAFIYKYINENKSNLSINYIERFGTKLKIPNHILDLAKKISVNIAKLDIASGHQPPSVASASLMLALKMSDLDIDKKLISKLFGISDVTITKTYKKILEYEYIISNNHMTESIVTMSNNEFYKSKAEFKILCTNYNLKYLHFVSSLIKFSKISSKWNHEIQSK
jgi:hypothetical protein